MAVDLDWEIDMPNYTYRLLLLCLVLASILGGCGSPETDDPFGAEFTPAFHGMTNLQYVHYLWKANGADRLLSLSMISDHIVMCRLYDLRTRRETRGEIEFYIDPNGEYRLHPKTYYNDPTDEDLDQLLLGATQIVCLSQDNPDYPITKHLIVEMKDFDTGARELAEFAHWVPFSGLVSITTADASQPYLKLVALGHFFKRKSMRDDIHRFFLVNKVPSGEVGREYRIGYVEAKTVVQAGLSYKLDANWAAKPKRPDLNLPHETYWFEPNGVRVAMIGVETLDTNEVLRIPNFFAKLIQTHRCVLADEAAIEQTPHGIRVRYTMIDPATGLENYVVHDHYSDTKGKTYSLTFSCLKSVYDVNKDYFIEIFDSVVPVDSGR